MSFPQPGPAFDGAVWVWNDEAHDLLMRALADKQPGDMDHEVEQVLHATNDYLGHSTKFRGVESVKSVRAAVESFNSEVDRDIEQGLAPAHPKLEPLEVASIVNLGLFDIDEVFEMFPSIRERFGGVPDALRPLLDTMASFQRDK